MIKVQRKLEIVDVLPHCERIGVYVVVCCVELNEVSLSGLQRGVVRSELGK